MARYIDADALIQKMQRALDENNDTSAADTILREVFEIIIGGLKEIPAADVQEVKHGKWIIEQLENEKDVCYCSQCGVGLQNRETRNYIDISGADYCPHCGAKMD